MKHIVHIFGLILCLLAGCAMNKPLNEMATADNETTRPAYLIISVNEIHPDKIVAYKEAVGPLVKKVGGADLIAVSSQENIEVLEGKWDLPGLLVIEKFESMEALKSFWSSDEYQEAKKLREGVAEANFFIAIEGQPLAQ